MGKSLKVRRWFETIRHHKPSQLARRVWTRVKRAGIGPGAARAYSQRAIAEVAGLREDLDLTELWRWKRRACAARGDIEQARPLVSGHFTLIGQTRHLRLPLDWNLNGWPDAPALWKFQLHSFEFLLPLLVAGEVEDRAEYCDTARLLVEDWIRQNHLGDPGWEQGGWHPYCISRRAVPWLLVAASEKFFSERASTLLQSLATQLLFVEDNLERDIGGNHLIANLKALLFGAAIWRGAAPDRWLNRAGTELLRQLESQILSCGQHFERSPTYHAIVLDDLLDIEQIGRQAFPRLAERLQSTIEAMASHLEAILHPDGQIPLFGDSAFDATPHPQILLGRVRGRGTPQNGSSATPLPTARRIGDYWIYRGPKRFLIFDAGPVAPDHLPAHGHADLLTIEASVGRQRLLVDSGTCCYEPSTMRDYCRSAAAHNTLQIDGTDQCDMWSSFRMGYRGHPLEFDCGEEGQVAWARASHDGYRRVGVPRVTRWSAVVEDDGPWFCVDLAAGRGLHQFEERLHLHPDVTAAVIQPNLVRLACAGQSIWLHLLGNSTTANLLPGWYCPRFGAPQRNTVVEWSMLAEAPHAMGWGLCFSETPLDIQLIHCRGQVDVHWMDVAGRTEPLSFSMPS